MRNKKVIKISSLLAPIFLCVCSLVSGVRTLPDTVYVKANEKNIESHVLSSYSNTCATNSTININDESNMAEVKLLGVLPVKSIKVKNMPDLELYPGGTPVGIKISTEGLLVVAFSDIENENGKIVSPAQECGINIGDIILEANGIKVKSSEELIKIINKEKGKTIDLLIMRKNEKIEKKLVPIKCDKDDKYKIGLWLRDSTAGVGTLTFYDKNTKKFAALGHPITDVDTNTLINIGKGNIVQSSIINVRKGVRGNPGELKGIFVDEDMSMGDIIDNTQCGIFGKTKKDLINPIFNKPLKIGLRNEIKEGPAQIITTIDENGPQLYDISIEKLLVQDKPGPKSMIIKVTDKTLLEKTGGIIQGMSGSPIIQNDKIVGAVTHVLINKPDTGYGIYIEWMIQDSGILAK